MRRVQNTEFATDVVELTASYDNIETTRLITERPAEPVEGEMWIDTVNTEINIYVGGKWICLNRKSAL